MRALIENLMPKLTTVRHQLHQIPETKYEEYLTSQYVAKHLSELGFKVKENIATTGLSTILDSGRPGKTIALRADMDALPLQEKTNLSYCSTHPGKMHACGHDGHTATLLGVAEVLLQMKDHLNGQVKFIFQPAEEGGNGAAAMIKEGILKTPQVDAIFGYHNWPGLPVGHIGTKSGCLMAARNNFDIEIKGKGGHAAMPELAIDPIIVGQQIVAALQTIASRSVSPLEPVVLSVTQFHAGTTFNVIPETAKLSVNLRTTSVASQSKAVNQVTKIAKTIANSFGASVNISSPEEYILPPTINHPDAVEQTLSTARNLWGQNQVVCFDAIPTMCSEDFSFYLQEVPGCFFFIGNGEKSPSLHNPHYDFNDQVLPIAIETMSQIAIDYLNQ